MNLASSPTNAGVFSFFVNPMSEDLGWSRSDLSWGFTCRLAVAGVSSPFLGILVDRYGVRWLGAIAGLIAGSSIMAFSLVESTWLFYLLSGVSGLSGFGGPAGQLLTIVPVAKWFQLNRGRAMAIATAGMPLGATLFLPAVQQMIEAFGWRTAWAVCGGLVIVLTVPVCALLMRKDPESMGLRPDGAPQSAASGSNTGRDETVVEHDWTLGQVLRTRTLWIILASIALSGLVIPGTVVYRVSYWEDIGLSPTVVAFGTSIDPLMVFLSGLVCGLLAERVPTRYLGFFGGAGVALSMAMMVIATDHLFFLFAYNFIWGVAMGANITVNNVIWPNYYGRRFLGTIRGVVFPVSVGSAAVSAPIFGALLASSLDARVVWAVTLVGFLTAGLLMLLARPPKLTERTEAVLVEAGR